MAKSTRWSLSRTLNLPPVGHPWQAQPRFDARGLVPWPDFLNCVTVYNREDWRAYLEAMVRMRFNTLGVHVYSAQTSGPSRSFPLNMPGRVTWPIPTRRATNRWGYLPERTSRYGMGGARLLRGRSLWCGSHHARPRSCWEAEEFAQKLWGEAFQYAKQLGIRTGVGFEPYQIPDEIYRATPPEAHYASGDPKIPGAAHRSRVGSGEGHPGSTSGEPAGSLSHRGLRLVVGRRRDELGQPKRKQGVPLSVTPFKQAYDFLKRHAPEKRLVISGWGGVVRHFAYFHKALPEDIIFSSLNDNLGWDPVSEEYGKLEARERWPIPWLEDDPAMWLPQFHVARFVRDMDLAEQVWVPGPVGHPLAASHHGYRRRFSGWLLVEQGADPNQILPGFCLGPGPRTTRRQIGKGLGGHGPRPADSVLVDGQIKNGHSEINEYSGDYDEAFQFWMDYEPPDSVKKSQAEVAQQLRALTDSASSPAERERLNYLTRFVEFLTPYSESWSLAYHLNQKLQKASELKKQNKADEARNLIVTEGVPLWLKLAPLVREVFLDYQEIVSTRNDLGQLASMHNKYERLALYRLRASMKEFLGELPPETEQLFAEVRQPDDKAIPRIFIPTRPTVLRKGERVRINAMVPGPVKVGRVTLFTRLQDTLAWSAAPMKLEGRRTYLGELQWRETSGVLLDFYVAAEVEASGNKQTLTSPQEGPERFHTVTLV